MEFSLAWLADYVDLPADPHELARRLTAAGLAVEGVTVHAGNIDDTVLDVDVTTNRPDCMNHFGLAREISVILGHPLKRPTAMPEEGPEPVGDALRVAIEDPEGGPRFAARVVRGVKVGPSPDWLRARLESIGLRSINNVVDVTNFVMLEIGQPLHAFDAAKLSGAINVRLANDGEKFLALDGRTYSLGKQDLVIADDTRAVGIAGVMGGEDTGVTDSTATLLLESAFFDPA